MHAYIDTTNIHTYINTKNKLENIHIDTYIHTHTGVHANIYLSRTNYARERSHNTRNFTKKRRLNTNGPHNVVGGKINCQAVWQEKDQSMRIYKMTLSKKRTSKKKARERKKDR